MCQFTRIASACRSCHRNSLSMVPEIQSVGTNHTAFLVNCHIPAHILARIACVSSCQKKHLQWIVRQFTRSAVTTVQKKMRWKFQPKKVPRWYIEQYSSPGTFRRAAVPRGWRLPRGNTERGSIESPLKHPPLRTSVHYDGTIDKITV